jgi:2,3-bisphosphoglycerate-dependent phosphoglycerate mutase
LSNLLVLVRHGQSEWNEKNLFTGWCDPGLTAKGISESREAGKALKKAGYRFDIAYTSALLRAQETNLLILAELGQADLPVIKDKALNERDYGKLSGLNKNDACKKWGRAQVHIWRRSYEISPPRGESLKDTAERVVPYYKREILPRILNSEHVLISAHGNSLRALVMMLDRLSEKKIAEVNIGTGSPIVYKLDDQGNVLSKDILIRREVHSCKIN